MVGPKLVRLSRWMQRVGIEHQSECRFAGGGEIGPHPAPHRPAGQHHRTSDLAGEEVPGGPMGAQQERLGVGALAAGLRVRVVEGQHRQPGPAEAVSQFDEPGVILIGPGAVGQQQPRFAVARAVPSPDEPARYGSLADPDPDFLQTPCSQAYENQSPHPLPESGRACCWLPSLAVAAQVIGNAGRS